MFDWLATRPGRLAAFFLLYVTEGIPLGYAATFVATLLRKEDISTEVIGAFVAIFYIPWSFKWAAGPVVDLARSRRLGPRRAWIVGTQLAMVVTLAACSGIGMESITRVLEARDAAQTDARLDDPRSAAPDATAFLVFTALIAINSAVAAVQDVAIDALAVDTLAESERGVANGLMFAGASAGSAFGGTGALWMYKAGGFSGATLLVASGLLLVLTTVSISLRERPTPNRDDTGSVRPIRSELTAYLRTAGRAFFGSRTGRLGVVFALLPAGAYALSLPLQSNLAVELGMSLDEIGWLNLATTLTFALLCVTGGFVSDRIGRRRSLAIFIALTTIPTVLFAVLLWKAGWVMPIENPKAPDRPMPPDWLVTAFWAASILFNIANGLMYGTRSAFYMDFCDPKVAATQFTAYMALMNLVISYTSFWQGWSIKTLGYPTTLVLDAAFGLVCLAVLAAVPFVRRPDRAAVPEAATEGRCPVCGADVSAEDAVCRKCGERLRAES